jgi:hypothetical protein
LNRLSLVTSTLILAHGGCFVGEISLYNAISGSVHRITAMLCVNRLVNQVDFGLMWLPGKENPSNYTSRVDVAIH